MRLLSINGVVETTFKHPTENRDAIQSIAEGLRERFDRVEQSGSSVQADASSFSALVLCGPRTHPMLPFNRVRIELLDGDPNRLRFHLDGTMQLLVAVFLVLAVGLGMSVERGLAIGMPTGLLFGGSLFLLNYVIARMRAVTWLSDRVDRKSF